MLNFKNWLEDVMHQEPTCVPRWLQPDIVSQWRDAPGLDKRNARALPKEKKRQIPDSKELAKGYNQ